MVIIPLTRGFSAIVDDTDADLSEMKWYASNADYAVRNIRNGVSRSTVILHRVIMSRVIGRELLQTEYVDHIDGNTMNNRRSNIRISNECGNARNRKVSKRNIIGVKGVSKHRNKWRVRLMANGKIVNIGLFSTLEEAAMAYRSASLFYHGNFACNPERMVRH